MLEKHSSRHTNVSIWRKHRALVVCIYVSMHLCTLWCVYACMYLCQCVCNAEAVLSQCCRVRCAAIFIVANQQQLQLPIFQYSTSLLYACTCTRPCLWLLPVHCCARGGGCTVGYLSFGPIEKYIMFCDLSVREKDWCSRACGAKAT